MTLLVTLTMASAVSAQPARVPAGRVKVVSGEASILREGQSIPATAGAVVFETDSLKTGANGRLGITLKDDTRISLGPQSEARLSRFAYAPARGQFAFVFNVVRGIISYVSGRIAKLSPDAVRLETPTAIVGVRGTRLAIRVAAP